MLRKQAKRILLVMLFVLTFVLAGRVDTNAQTAAPAGVKQVKAGSSSVTVQWDAVMQNDCSCGNDNCTGDICDIAGNGVGGTK